MNKNIYFVNVLKYLFIVVVFVVSSCGSLGLKENKPMLLTVSENQRYLMTCDGEPFFWMGDTGWLLFSKLTREEAVTYLDNRAKKGFNVVQAMLIHQLNLANAYGDSALVNGNIAQPYVTEGNSFDKNDEYDYWDHIDYIIQLAHERGIYMALVPVWGSNVKQNKVSVDQAAIYSTWLAKRYAKRTNIIWLNGGDTKGDQNTDVWKTIGEKLNEFAPDHLISFHPFGRTKSSMWFHNENWLHFNMFQSGHRRYDQDNTQLAYGEDNWRYVRDDYSLALVKPTLDGEPSYEGIPQGLHDTTQPYWNSNDLRRYAYWSVFAGACGFTYGHSAVMQMHKPSDSAPAYGVREYWFDALDAEGAQQMLFLKELILSKPYFQRIPDQSIIAGENGFRYDYKLATRGDNYAFIYSYNGSQMNIQMGIIQCDSVRTSWFNPRDGSKSSFGVYENNGIYAFDPPGTAEDGNDWVLVLESI